MMINTSLLRIAATAGT